MLEGMMERVLISRQPIYRADKTVLGYELLFRDSDTDHASFSDGARATAQVLVNSLMEIGMDQLVGRQKDENLGQFDRAFRI